MDPLDDFEEPPKICGIIPVVRVRDILEAIRFYEIQLGFGDAWAVGEPPRYGGVSAEGLGIIFEQADDPIVPDQDIFSIMVTGVDVYYADLRGMGVEIVRPLIEHPYGLRDFVIRDNNGYRISIGEMRVTTLDDEECVL